MSSIGIFGYGRFGKVLAQLLAKNFQVKVHDPIPPKHLPPNVSFVEEEVLLQEKILFIAIPINKFEAFIKSIANKLSSNTTVLDVCSIKTYPVQIMEKYLPENVGIIATHPLFGPDSILAKDQYPLNFVMYPVRDTYGCYNTWKHYFSQMNFHLVEISPEEHDRLCAQSQGIVHFVARFLKEAKIHPTPIDTLGFKQLCCLVENNCHDTWELFQDLQKYNPYSQEMLAQLEKAFNSIMRAISTPKA